jgi:2,3-bisphosphoglycerate-independent phosphoglycerate mutase
MDLKKPTVLVILDGFGYRKEKKFNAIAQARTPHIDFWMEHFPTTLLRASGTAVGLLDNMIGNSEVGHLTIGCGRIIEQPLTIIHHAIENKSIFSHPLLLEKFALLKHKNEPLHIMGLLSDAGIHSHVELLYALLKMAVEHGLTKIYVHAFLDGRDTPPKSAAIYLSQLDTILHTLGHGIIATMQGRFYAMDRDKNWDRTEKSYKVLTEKQQITKQDWQEVLSQAYQHNITDEFVPPTQLDPQGIIESGAGVIFFNIRPDRARQLTAAFVDPHFNHFPIRKINLTFFITPVGYGAHLKTDVLYPQKPEYNTLKDVLSEHDKTIFSIAETEKYAHITYFFNGGREKILPHEVRILIPSIIAKTYVDHPQMSAPQITEAVLKSLKKIPKDFYLINYANADMVGHSGNFQATVKAVECLDTELKKLYDVVVESMGGTMYITADHGKAEDMYDPETGMPRTAHTNNPVPFIMLRKDLENSNYTLPLTQLADIAPFILHNMHLPIPTEMEHLAKQPDNN